MKLKVISVVTGLLIALSLVASATGQTSSPEIRTRGVRVYLKLEVSGSFKQTHLMITNNTSSKVPKGTKVYWEINPQERGSFVLPAMLVPGDSYRLTVETHSLLLASTKAWYFKTPAS